MIYYRCCYMKIFITSAIKILLIITFFLLFSGFLKTAHAQDCIRAIMWLCQEDYIRCPSPYRNVCCREERECPDQTQTESTPAYFCDSGDPNSGIETAIGCVPYVNINEFTGYMLAWFIGIAGGTAFIMMIYGGFLIITSAGNPERVGSGKVILTSAISGLLFLVFSVFILRVIGLDILKIPGF